MQMFRSVGVDPGFNFSGEILGSFISVLKPFDAVLLTVDNTQNDHIKLVNIYINGERRGGTRYNKNRLGIFEVDIMLNRIYWDYLCQSIK